MRWRRGNNEQRRGRQEPDPLVLSIHDPVTRDTASGLVARVTRLAASQPVVIDVTAIPAFDSEGAAAVAAMQERLGGNRVTVVGFRQAAARLVGSVEDHADPAPAPAGQWVIRRLRAIAVVQTTAPASDSAGMEQALEGALAEEVAIVVLDLRDVRIGRGVVQAVAFASSQAALRGQELLVVNVDEGTAEKLRRAGLSATTYMAPEPLPGM